MANRTDQIMQELLRSGRVSVEELAHKLHVSDVSVRRDLRRLEQQGLLRRDHGGAIPVGPLLYVAFTHDSSFQEQIHHQAEAKRRIGLAAADLVRDGDAIALTTGTTTTHVARSLHKQRGILVLTNSINVAMELSNREGITVQVSGGLMRGVWFSLVGESAIQTIEQIFVDKVFIGVNGISVEHGLTDFHVDEAAVNKAMIRQAKQKIVVADHTKLGVLARYRICPIQEIDMLITDDQVSDEQVGGFEAAGIEVRRA
jgi:DeoR family transcriptional regulator, aga operon transcriptional repressor